MLIPPRFAKIADFEQHCQNTLLRLSFSNYSAGTIRKVVLCFTCIERVENLLSTYRGDCQVPIPEDMKPF